MIPTRTTRAKRKLLSPAILANVALRHDLDVPLAAVVRQLELDISRAALATLLHWYKEQDKCEGDKAATIQSSLFPDWLDADCKNVQENPTGWAYTGRFPLGHWTYNADNSTVY